MDAQQWHDSPTIVRQLKIPAKSDFVGKTDIHSIDPGKIELIEDGSQNLIYFHPRINDIKRINNSLVLINKKLRENGLLVCNCESIEQRNRRNRVKYGRWSSLFFPIDFLYKRVAPKIIGFKQLYFWISNGKNRVLSKAETLGRLYFCGFEISQIEEVDNKLHLIMRKVKKPSDDPAPSYGPLFKKKSTGPGGKTVYIHKLRTMHPYSEYLRNTLRKENGYSSTGNGIGKIDCDYRVTSWGQLLRKYWLDELPQLINLIKGDLKLVGLRPLGNSIFDECPADMQHARLTYKSGCIPPYYYDLPKNIEEVYESERRYIAAYEKHPVRTDVRYFFKAMNNIILKNARSK